MIAPVLITPPAASPVSVEEAKAWLRVDATEEDALIEGTIAAAVSSLEGRHGMLGRCLITQTWRQDFDDWGAYSYLSLPFSGVSAVVVKYFDSDNVEQTVSSADYELVEDECGCRVSFLDGFSEPAVYARADAVRVTMTCGFGTAEDVPAAIRLAIKMTVAHWYEHREATGHIPMGAMQLLAPYRSIHV